MYCRALTIPLLCHQSHAASSDASIFGITLADCDVTNACCTQTTRWTVSMAEEVPLPHVALSANGNLSGVVAFL